MYNKFENTKVGDYVTRSLSGWSTINKGHLLGQVTKVTKTQIVAEVMPSGDQRGGYRVRINKRTGKELGTRAYWHPTDDPERIHELNREAKRQREQQIEEKKRRNAEKMAAVLEANPYGLEPTILTMGIRMLEWRDRHGRWNVLFYSVEERTEWNGRVVTTIHPAQYGPNNLGPGFSTTISQDGNSEEDAVVRLLAREF